MARSEIIRIGDFCLVLRDPLANLPSSFLPYLSDGVSMPTEHFSTLSLCQVPRIFPDPYLPLYTALARAYFPPHSEYKLYLEQTGCDYFPLHQSAFSTIGTLYRESNESSWIRDYYSTVCFDWNTYFTRIREYHYVEDNHFQRLSCNVFKKQHSFCCLV